MGIGIDSNYHGVKYYQNADPNPQDYGEVWYKPSTRQLWIWARNNSWVPLQKSRDDIGLIAGTENSLNTIEYVIISFLNNANNFADLSVSRIELAAASNGSNNRGVFSGGDHSGSMSNVIDYVTISSTSTALDFGDLSVEREDISGTSNGTNDRAIFSGGSTPSFSKIIDYITISSLGIVAVFGDLFVSRSDTASTSNSTNERGIIAGGDGELDSIDYVTISLATNANDFGDLTLARQEFAGISNSTNERGVFAGGLNSSIIRSTIDYVTINSSPTTTASVFGNLDQARKELAGCSSGTDERGIFCGGNAGLNLNVIDYITISNENNANDFGDLTAWNTDLAGTSNCI